MSGTVHVLLGAAVGSLFSRRSTAFLAGVVSHLVGDILPHQEAPPQKDIPLSLCTFSALVVQYGFHSPICWGALGGTCPDVEHILTSLGVIQKKDRLFPTHEGCLGFLPHSAGGRPKTDRVQVFLAGSSLLLLTLFNHRNSRKLKGKGDEAE